MTSARQRATDLEQAEVHEFSSMLAEPEVLQKEQRQRRTRLLWQGRRLLGRFALTGLVLGLLTALLIHNWYQTTVRLMPPDNKGSALSLLMAASGGGGGTGGAVLGDVLGLKSQNTGDLMLEILRSRTVEDRVIERLHLKEVYHTRLDEDTRDTLAANTKLTVDSKSGVMNIVVTDRDPRRVKDIGAAYVDELNRAVTTFDTSAAHREREFIEQRLKLVKSDLDSATADLAKFSSQSTTLDPKEQGLAMVENVARVQGQLMAAQAQLSGLEQIYTENNVRVRSTQAQIEELKHELQKIGGNTDAKPEDQLIYPSIKALPGLGATWTDLYRRVKLQETIYEVLTKQYELAKVQEAKELPSIRVLDAAEVPERKAGPHRLWITLGGGFLFLILGMAWILGLDKVEQMPGDDPWRIQAERLRDRVRDTKVRALSRVRGNGAS